MHQVYCLYAHTDEHEHHGECTEPSGRYEQAEEMKAGNYTAFRNSPFHPFLSHSLVATYFSHNCLGGLRLPLNTSH
jgi:hypothetical protein